MDDKKIHLILQDALEEAVPSAELNLWPAVKASFAAREPEVQGDNMNIVKPNRMPRFAVVLSMVLVAAAVALATPQGRSLAQSVLQLFVRAENTSFPLTDPFIADVAQEPPAATAEAPPPPIAVSEAAALAGFPVAELSSVPRGFDYLGARLNGRAVSIEYQAQGGGGGLFITQSQEGIDQTNWEQVPEDAIVPVKIGEQDGEFAQGIFVVYPGDTVATWNPDAAVLRLRWLKDGIQFEIAKFGDVHGIEYLDQAGMIDLAESLMLSP